MVCVAEHDAVVEVRGVTRRFGGVAALDGVSLNVPRGSVFGLVGENGAGKTTLISISSGYIGHRGEACGFSGWTRSPSR